MTPAGEAAVFLCGPRAGGNSDTAGLAFAEALAAAGAPVRVVKLREQRLEPCRGCGACAGPGNRCPLDKDDDAAEALFDLIKAAPVVAFAAPIYFYHVPALFKAFIDRAQRRYAARLASAPRAVAPAALPAHVLLVAGRQRGEKLFEGALLTLKYFLWPLSRELAAPCLLRGMDAPGDLAADAAALADVAALGRAAARAAYGR
ncbi:NAD(P)H-dependent oxidoreductase [Solidesulfovibrio sp.]|uniref:NAD(P)H-dependent oxidoreductase n=1 Tax=Solidesulfovibrio sp. TaxID=2910990 RepID=UPI002B20D25B|nr:NAD(P)H-dependent oxidoreductase [Solidesulfovibrio sp.]MEA5088902.1 NAD(P)H-dependent oxidoreductase [Solidesulfovibrio sp.]